MAFSYGWEHTQRGCKACCKGRDKSNILNAMEHKSLGGGWLVLISLFSVCVCGSVVRNSLSPGYTQTGRHPVLPMPKPELHGSSPAPADPSLLGNHPCPFCFHSFSPLSRTIPYVGNVSITDSLSFSFIAIIGGTTVTTSIQGKEMIKAGGGRQENTI